MTPSKPSLALIKWTKPGIIYVARNRVNGKLYVGQTIKSLARRRGDHFYSAKHDPKFAFHVAIAKYGRDSFEFSIVQKCSDRSCLNAAESWWICNLGSFGLCGYNLTTGGEGCEDSEETRKKKSEAYKRKVSPEEHKRRLDLAHASLRGKKWSAERRRNQPKMEWSEERKKKHSEFMKNDFSLSEEARQKISRAKLGKSNHKILGVRHPGRGKGRVFSEEHKRNIASAKTGKPRPDMVGNTWNVGRIAGPPNEEHRKKISETKRRNNAIAKSSVKTNQIRLDFG